MEGKAPNYQTIKGTDDDKDFHKAENNSIDNKLSIDTPMDNSSRSIGRAQDLSVNKVYMGMLCFFSTIGGFLFGYDTSVIAGANLYIDNDFKDVTDLDKEVIVSFTLLGAAFGSLFGGPIADKAGRKPTIFVADVLFTGGCIVMAFAPSIFVLVIGRFIVGLGVGVAAMVVPVYLAEVAPKEIRGTLVNLNVLFITLGQFLALVICLLLGERWRWMLGLAGVPSALQAVGILFLCESPRFLFKKGKEEEAQNAIQKLYNADYELLQPVFNEQKDEALKVKRYESYGYFNLAKQLFTKYRPCLIAGCCLQMCQQLCGINTAMYYGPEIMKQAGFGDDNNKAVSLISSLPLAGMNALGSVIALFFIDRLGRRWIILRTLPFVALFMGVIGIGMGLRNHTDKDTHSTQVIGKWCAASGIFLYLLAFAIGMGPTPWTVNSEIYPLHLRGIGNSMSSTTNWISNFAVAMSFLTLMKHVPYGDIIAFMLIVVFCTGTYIFVFLKIPETKGLSMDEVLALFIKKEDNLFGSERSSSSS